MNAIVKEAPQVANERILSAESKLSRDIVRYEVAAEILAGESGFLSQALRAEKSKSSPNQFLVNYYEARIRAVVDLEYDFRYGDNAITDAIFNQKRIFGCRGND